MQSKDLILSIIKADINHLMSLKLQITFYKLLNNVRKTITLRIIILIGTIRTKLVQNLLLNHQQNNNDFICLDVRSSQSSVLNSPRNSFKSIKNKKYKKFDPDRYNLCKLNGWLSQKMKEAKESQKQLGTILTQRIHALHLAFSEACRQASKYSHQIGQILSNVHCQYHEVYQNLVSCFIKINLSLKKKNQQLQEIVNNTINNYEKEILKLRLEHEKKSAKVIQSFHKCIAVKEQMQEQNKRLNIQIKNQRARLGFAQQGLAKAIQIILEIGQNKFKFLSREQQQKILLMAEQLKGIPDNYSIFHKWCSTVLQIISNSKQKSLGKQKKKQKQDIICEHEYKKFAIKTISSFMTDFDPSLSVKDAEAILLDFITRQKTQSNSVQIKQAGENEQSQNGLILPSPFSSNAGKYAGKEVQKKIIQGLSNLQPVALPNLYDISQKLKGVNVETQITGTIDSQSKCIQTLGPQKAELGISAKPKTLNKQVQASNKSRLFIVTISSMNMFVWAQAQLNAIEQQPKFQQTAAPKPIKQVLSPKISVIESNFHLQNYKRRNQKKGTAESLFDKSLAQGKAQKILNKNGQNNQLQRIVQDGQQQQKKAIETKSNHFNFHKNSKIKPINRQNNVLKKVTFQQKAVLIKDQQKIMNPGKENNSVLQKEELKSSFIKATSQSRKKIYQIDKQKTNQQNKSKKQSQEQKIAQRRTVQVKNMEFLDSNLLDDQYDTHKRSKSISYLRNSIDLRQKSRSNIDNNSDIQDQKRKEKKNRKNGDSDNQNQSQADQYLMSNRKSNPKLKVAGRHMKINLGPSRSKHLKSNRNKGQKQYANCKDRESIMVDLIKESKKQNNRKYLQRKNYIESSPVFQSNKHQFMIQAVSILQQKNRKITQSIMWNYKKNIQIEKLVKKLRLSKQRVLPANLNFQATIDFAKIYIDPIIKAYLTMFIRLTEFESKVSFGQFKANLLSGRKISYYHRLAPVLHILINLMGLNCMGIGKCSKQAANFYKSIKSLKKMDRRLEIYDQLIEGSTIQLDVLIKIIYYFSENKSICLQNQYVQLNVIELQLFFVLQLYLTPGEINSLLSQLRSIKRQDTTSSISSSVQCGGQMLINQGSSSDQISLNSLVLKILKYIGHKKTNLVKKYRTLLQILCNKQGEEVSFTDLIYFIEAFPTDKNCRYKILLNSTHYLVHWSKKQAVIPADRLVFLLQSSKFLSNEVLEKNLVVQYFKIKCEKQYKSTFDKIVRNPEYVLQSVYRLLFRVPQMISRLTQELISSKNTTSAGSILAVLYANIIEDEIEKLYMSGYLNALSAISIMI